MKTPAIPHQFPQFPELHDFFDGVDYCEIKTISGQTDLNHFIAGMLSYHPWWVALLFRLRAAMVLFLGLQRQDMPQNSFRVKPNAISFIPGTQVSFFTVRKAREGVYWLAESPEDKHLSACLTIFATPSATDLTLFNVVTTIRYKHWTGPVYFNLIRPFHHLLLNAAMRASILPQALK